MYVVNERMYNHWWYNGYGARFQPARMAVRIRHMANKLYNYWKIWKFSPRQLATNGSVRTYVHVCMCVYVGCRRRIVVQTNGKEKWINSKRANKPTQTHMYIKTGVCPLWVYTHTHTQPYMCGRYYVTTVGIVVMVLAFNQRGWRFESGIGQRNCKIIEKFGNLAPGDWRPMAACAHTSEIEKSRKKGRKRKEKKKGLAQTYKPTDSHTPRTFQKHRFGLYKVKD